MAVRTAPAIALTLLAGALIGMKPPQFAAWKFGLLGASRGDRLDDLFPGSEPSPRPGCDTSRTPGANASPEASDDATG